MALPGCFGECGVVEWLKTIVSRKNEFEMLVLVKITHVDYLKWKVLAL